jgi:hypothetical protein
VNVGNLWKERNLNIQKCFSYVKLEASNADLQVVVLKRGRVVFLFPRQLWAMETEKPNARARFGRPDVGLAVI